ncbi:MAG: hypothetical protein M1375_01025 [Candidatus Thermoplasmatota archaeon]|nr:hypothetical protein [Candidatus Thermoplasmatota archaeon]MCL5790541.1 hypothetical protein [Candidatus Thermoplasmatota archaeon]
MGTRYGKINDHRIPRDRDVNADS